MKNRALVFSCITLAFGCVAPFSFGQAASSNGDAAKPKVVITDDNLAEQLPAKPADDQSAATADPAAQPAAAPTAMSDEEITALESTLASKRATLTEIQNRVTETSAKLEQETDDDKKSREQDFINSSQKTIAWYTSQIADMEKMLAEAKAHANANGPTPTADGQAAAQPEKADDTSK
jgi:hypothetical protein